MNNPLSLGTIRTIDDLGRIVLPRQIRDKLGIHPKDSLEIRTNGQTILLKKYEEMQTLLSLCNEYLEAFAKSSSTACAICSTQFVLATRGIALSDNYPLSGPVRKLIKELQVYHYQDTEKIPIFDNSNYYLDSLYPIGTVSKPLGCVVLFHFRPQTKEERACAKYIADILTNMLSKEDAYVTQ